MTERGIEYGELLEKCLKFVPNNVNLMTERIFQYCFTHAKILRAPSGDNRLTLEKDRRRMMHLNFIEFVVFLCLLAYKLGKDEIRENSEEGFYPLLKNLIENILNFFELKVTQVPPPDQDPRGDEVPHDLLINGEIIPFVPPTPEKFRESMHYDMYSELSQDNPKQEKITFALKRKKDMGKRTFNLLVGNEYPTRKIYDSPL